MKVRRSLLKDTVAVETYSGEGAYGPVYAAAANVPCHIDNDERLVRSMGGDEVVSSARLTIHPANAAAFTPESRLTIQGRSSTVISTNVKTVRGSACHAEVICS